MTEHRLKEAFDPFYQAPIEVWKHFYALCEEASFKKDQNIKLRNTMARYGYFLISGCVGSFVWKKNGYACLDFFFEGSFFGDDYSLNTGNPSELELIAIEDAALLKISKAHIERLKETPLGKTLFLIGEQNDGARREKQRMDLMIKSAEERYLDLLNHQKGVIERIPQKHIASYLGITKQSLSRIRRKISQTD